MVFKNEFFIFVSFCWLLRCWTVVIVIITLTLLVDVFFSPVFVCYWLVAVAFVSLVQADFFFCTMNDTAATSFVRFSLDQIRYLCLENQLVGIYLFRFGSISLEVSVWFCCKYTSSVISHQASVIRHHHRNFRCICGNSLQTFDVTLNMFRYPIDMKSLPVDWITGL